MADEDIHKQHFNVRNLQTRSVTLYPTSAQIVREISDVTLKPGANEITILGFTPTADETSIKVDGKGSATITDTTVELIPNPDNYEDVYPESGDDAQESEDDQGESEPDSDAAKALAEQKKRKKAAKEKSKKLGKKQKLLQEKLTAKRRLKEERAQFWPRKVYRVTLSIDTHSELTPASSRRGSINSLAKSPDSCQISMSVSYITHSAYWSPRYDLSLNTITSSGLVVYSADYCNTTSEAWKDAQVILSTSQTAFKPIEPRNVLFGLEGLPFIPQQANFKAQQQAMQNVQRQQQQQQMQQPQAQAGFGQAAQQQRAPAMVPGAFGSRVVASNVTSSNSALFGSSNAGRPSSKGNRALQDYQMQLMLLEQQKKKRLMVARQEQDTISGAGGYSGDFNDGNAETIIPELPTLETQESEWTESGLTSTYEIPGLRTVAPSFTTRRDKIDLVRLSDVHLSYVLVPKVRAAAFLKARLRNNSSLALLKGLAGLTLDGSFLGNTILPRCSAAEHFHLSLGVDPSVAVTYSKSVARRSKEGSGVYTRTCTITNTKSNRAIEGTVLDQILVSEDERLRVEVLQPVGLRAEGDAVKTGTGVATVGEGMEKWGRATAALKKGGEVAWEVKIEPGRGAKLVLQYEAKHPNSEVVVGV